VKRRTFIVQGISAALALPLRALAQPARLPVVGFLGAGTAEDGAALVDAFRTGLAEAGFVDGRDVAIDYRWGNDRPERLRMLAGELANRPVRALIVSGGRASAEAALAATASLPILLTDIAATQGSSFVANAARPGANVTGALLSAPPPDGRRLDFLRELVPSARRIGYLHAGSVGETAEVIALRAICANAGSTLLPMAAKDVAGVEAAFAGWREQKADALIVSEPMPSGAKRGDVVALAARFALPACYERRDSVVLGGLMSYGLDLAPGYLQAGNYAARILNGALVRDLPVVEVGKVDLVINLATARQLQLTVPRFLRASANELIE
jgi:putative ABC transport system substrate-binding protein